MLFRSVYDNEEFKDMEFVGNFQKPWKKLENSHKNQVRMNTFLKADFNVFQDKELLTTSLIYSYKESVPPLYIAGTNKGNVYIFSILMKDARTMFPILKIESNNEAGINKLYIKQGKLLISSIKGSLSIADITIKKVQRSYEKYFAEQNTSNVYLYRDVTNRLELISKGIAGFLEPYDLSQIDLDEISGRFQLVDEKDSEDLSSFCKDNIGIVGCDNSIFIVSLFTSNIINKYKGHDSKVVGLYINETANSLLVITEKSTVYIYSMASRTLERRVTGNIACELFDLTERNNKFLPNEIKKYEDVLKIYTNKDIVFKKGCNKAIDFCNYMEYVQTRWKDPSQNKGAIYYSINSELDNNDISNSDNKVPLQIKLFNTVANFEDSLNLNKKNAIGYTAIRIKIGRKNRRAEKLEVKNSKVIYDEINKNNVIIIELEDLLDQLRKNSRKDEGPIYELFNNTKEEIKVGASPNKSFRGIPQDRQVNRLWPLPLVSLIHSFGINEKIDSELSNEFCICPPMLQLWVGIPGVESSFSFSIPEVFDTDWSESQGLYNWKVSPYLNSLQSITIFTSLVTIFHVNETFIASVINKLLGSIIQFLSSNKMLPYISFMRLGSCLNCHDTGVWRDRKSVV